MTKRMETLPTPKTNAVHKAVIDALLDDMLRIEERMQEDRVEIERFRAHSEVIGRHTDGLLEELAHQIAALTKAA